MNFPPDLYLGRYQARPAIGLSREETSSAIIEFSLTNDRNEWKIASLCAESPRMYRWIKRVCEYDLRDLMDCLEDGRIEDAKEIVNNLGWESETIVSDVTNLIRISEDGDLRREHLPFYSDRY